MADMDLPRNTEELLDEIEREWTALLAVVKKTNPAQMTRPDEGGWSPKDNLAHLSAWMRFQLDHHMAGRPPDEVMEIDSATFETLDENGINAVLFERNRNRSTAEVLEELKRTYVEMVETLKSTPFSDLMKPHSPDDPEKRPQILWVRGNTSEHFAEHRQAIENANRRK